MLALFLGTASLPHILIRYYTVPSQKDARKSTIVAIAAAIMIKSFGGSRATCDFLQDQLIELVSGSADVLKPPVEHYMSIFCGYFSNYTKS